VSWKSPGNLLGWICRHPAPATYRRSTTVLCNQPIMPLHYFITCLLLP